MRADALDIAEHMRDFGLGILAHAIRNAGLSEYMHEYAHAVAITLAAQAAEILIKARIVQEHPLLIFDALPKPSGGADILTLESLFISGRTVTYTELPDLLWAATNYHIPNRTEYEAFGRFRNQLQHFAIPNENLSVRTLRFVFTVVAPMVKDFWGDNVLTYLDRINPDDIEYVEEYLQRLGLPFDTAKQDF